MLIPLARLEHLERLRDILQRMQLTLAGRLLAEVTRGKSGDTLATLSTLCDEHAAEWIRHRLTVTGEEHAGTTARNVSLYRQDDGMGLARSLLNVSRSADHPTARDMLDALTPGSRTSPVAVYRHAIRVRNDQLREAIRALAVHRAIGLFQHRWQVTELWNAMMIDPSQQPVALLRTLLGATRRYQQLPAEHHSSDMGGD